MRSSLILHLRIAHTKPQQTNRFDSCTDTVKDTRCQIWKKKLNMCLIQGWCYKKSLSTVPKSENYAIERFQRLATQYSFKTNCQFVLKFHGTLQKGFKDFPRNLSNTDSADRFPF